MTTIVAELRRIVDERVPDDELTKARNMLKGRLVLGLEDPRSIIAFGLRGTILEGEPREIPEVLAGLDAVTADDVGRVAETLLAPEKLRLRGDRAVRGRGPLRGPAGLILYSVRLGLDAVEALIQRGDRRSGLGERIDDRLGVAHLLKALGLAAPLLPSAEPRCSSRRR